MIGDFNSATLVVDPVSGFLIKSNHVVKDLVRRADGTIAAGNGVDSELVFTPDKKLDFLRRAVELWPNISAICDEIGISRQTYRNHYDADEKFHQEVDRIKDRAIDQIENVRMKVANQPSGSFDRMCVLNAYRREIYNPKIQVEVEHKITADEGRRRLDALSHAVDVEIVDTVRKIKAQRAKPHRPQNPNGHGDPK